MLQYSGDGTWYDDVGYTSCGEYVYGDGDYAAISWPQSDELDPTCQGNPNNCGWCNTRAVVTGPAGSATVRLLDKVLLKTHPITLFSSEIALHGSTLLRSTSCACLQLLQISMTRGTTIWPCGSGHTCAGLICGVSTNEIVYIRYTWITWFTQ